MRNRSFSLYRKDYHREWTHDSYFLVKLGDVNKEVIQPVKTHPARPFCKYLTTQNGKHGFMAGHKL